MSRIRRVATGTEISLMEYMVGAATERCIYPGIAQCFAVAGMGPTAMVCTHVSPGITAPEMDETFTHLAALGGGNVGYWYIVGPCRDHFGTSTAIWRSNADIKKTFKKKLNNKSATYMLLDASDERHTMRMYEGIDFPMEFSSIDVSVQRKGIALSFAYKERKRDVTTWTEFDLTKFQRL